MSPRDGSPPGLTISTIETRANRRPLDPRGHTLNPGGDTWAPVQTMTPKLLGLLAAALVLAAPAAAELGALGSTVKVGDSDYVQMVKRTPIPVRALEIDTGKIGEALDNCILLVTDSTDGGAVPAYGFGTARPVRVKDQHLTPCNGQKTGTLINDASVLQKSTPAIERAVEVRYGDATPDGKYGKADMLYLTTMTTLPGPPATGARGLAMTGATGTWTIRLTPFGALPAGSFVKADDPDFILYRDTATGPGGAAPGSVAGATGTAFPAVAGADLTWTNTPRIACFGVVEREGGPWYVVPSSGGCSWSATTGAWTAPAFGGANTAIPIHAVRLGVPNPQGQPSVQPTRIELSESADYSAGKSLPFTVRVANEGPFAGSGLVVVRLDGAIVDLRMTPVLSPQETATLSFKVQLPPHGGEVELAVNEMEVKLDVAGPVAVGSASASLGVDPSQIAALEQKIADLEGKLASQSTVATAPPSTANTPGVAPVLLLVGMALLAIFRRQRKE